MRPWVYAVCAVPVLIFCGIYFLGALVFAPLGSMLGDPWHYNGGVGLGHLSLFPGSTAIAYSSSRTGTSHIYSIAWNGNSSRQLTNDRRGDSDVYVSPIGKQMVFVRQDGDNTHLWLMNANGTGQHRITSGPDSQTQPCFSPNGRQIAYVNSPHYGIWRIQLMNANGTVLRRLTNTNEQDTTPTFDQTGASVYYSHYSDAVGRLQIYAVNVAGGTPRLLGFGTLPTISPNGKQIAFYDQPQNQTLGIMNVDGTGRRTIGTDIGDGMHLVFCPDGNLLTYRASSDSSKDNLVTIAPNGGGTHIVATIDASSHYPNR